MKQILILSILPLIPFTVLTCFFNVFIFPLCINMMAIPIIVYIEKNRIESESELTERIVKLEKDINNFLLANKLQKQGKIR